MATSDSASAPPKALRCFDKRAAYPHLSASPLWCELDAYLLLLKSGLAEATLSYDKLWVELRLSTQAERDTSWAACAATETPMDAPEWDRATPDRELAMTDAIWESALPPMEDYTHVPELSHDGYLDLWSNQLGISPSSFQMGTGEEMPQYSLEQPSLESLAVPNLQSHVSGNAEGTGATTVLDWMDFDMDLGSAGAMPAVSQHVETNRQKHILANWIATNSEPYPSREEKTTLAASTGLTVKQVSGWFTRTRQRILPRVQATRILDSPDNIPTLGTLQQQTTIKKVSPTPSNQRSKFSSASKCNLSPIYRYCLLDDHLHSTSDGPYLGSASLPLRPKRYPVQSSPKRSQSLPPIFTLKNLHPHIDIPSQASQGLSLNVVASAHPSTRQSAISQASNKEKPARTITPSINLDLIRPLRGTSSSSLSFVAAWVQDVAKHAVDFADSHVESTALLPQNASIETNTCDRVQNTEESINSTKGPGYREFLKSDPSMFPASQLEIKPLSELEYETPAAQLERYVEESGRNSEYVRTLKSCIELGRMEAKRRQVELGRNGKSFDVRSMSSAGSSASSANFSADSVGSASSYMSFGPRKGRRVPFLNASQEHSGKRKASDHFDEDREQKSPVISGVFRCTECGDIFTQLGNLKYHKDVIHPHVFGCTFCRKGFDNPYSWRRHEETVHAPQVHWICAPPFSARQGISESCPICTAQVLFENGVFTDVGCTHRFHTCWETPKSERTFFRKDALKQHIRAVHYKDGLMPSIIDRIGLDQWVEEVDTTTYDLTCHICGFACKSWEERALHIIEHFKRRESIKLWIPGGPYILRPNGSTVYLAAAERRRNTPSHYSWSCGFIGDLNRKETWAGFDCSLCGAVAQVFPISHLNQMHKLFGCTERHSDFHYAEDFIQHLVSSHTAVRGVWMWWNSLVAENDDSRKGNRGSSERPGYQARESVALNSELRIDPPGAIAPKMAEDHILASLGDYTSRKNSQAAREHVGRTDTLQHWREDIAQPAPEQDEHSHGQAVAYDELAQLSWVGDVECANADGLAKASFLNEVLAGYMQVCGTRDGHEEDLTR
ncbi:hypothetical protein F5Y19DRAFT_478907 [Xylariaceae sp. FL1651]|nr:hypothetical protein F5Y19DRAFT_478907 [Xylariaceae sp. FL1651]